MMSHHHVRKRGGGAQPARVREPGATTVRRGGMPVQHRGAQQPVACRAASGRAAAEMGGRDEGIPAPESGGSTDYSPPGDDRPPPTPTPRPLPGPCPARNSTDARPPPVQVAPFVSACRPPPWLVVAPAHPRSLPRRPFTRRPLAAGPKPAHPALYRPVPHHGLFTHQLPAGRLAQRRRSKPHERT